MLHQISWFTYAISILALLSIYYLYVGFTFYSLEIQSAIRRFTGKQPALKVAGSADLQIPDYDIMGKAQAADVEFVSQKELSFAPTDDRDETETPEVLDPCTNSRLIGSFSEMISKRRP